MSRHTARARSGSDRTSLYDEITIKIISVIGAASAPFFFLIRAIEQSLQVGHGPAKLIGAAEQLDDFGGLAVG